MWLLLGVYEECRECSARRNEQGVVVKLTDYTYTYPGALAACVTYWVKPAKVPCPRGQMGAKPAKVGHLAGLHI